MLATPPRVLFTSLAILLALAPSAIAQDDRPPRTKNRSKIERLMIKHYPLAMRKAGVIGEPIIELIVGINGKPREITLVLSSGTPVLDEAALEIAAEMRFDPARSGGEKVEQPVIFPLSFQTACGVARREVLGPDRVAAVTGLNAALIDIHAEKPTSTALLAVTVDSAGTPVSAKIINTTGLADADTLVTRLAMGSQYAPACWEGQAVPSSFRIVVAPVVAPPVTRSDQRLVCGNGTSPKLKNFSALSRRLMPIARALHDARSDVTLNATARLYVGIDGRVEKIHVVGSSCWDDLDRLLTDVWKRARFEAATCNGEPIGTWLDLPVILNQE